LQEIRGALFVAHNKTITELPNYGFIDIGTNEIYFIYKKNKILPLNSSKDSIYLNDENIGFKIGIFNNFFYYVDIEERFLIRKNLYSTEQYKLFDTNKTLPDCLFSNNFVYKPRLNKLWILNISCK